MAGPYYAKPAAGTEGSGTFRGLWSASKTWAAGDIIAPSVAYATAAAKGYIYRCTTAGAGGGTEPAWVYTTPGTSTTTDSAAVFTCEEATTWAYASPRPDYIAANKLADNEIVYAATSTYSGISSITLPGPGSQLLSTSDTTNAPPTSLAVGAELYAGAGTSINLSIGGRGYMYGVIFKGGGTSAAGLLLGSNDNRELYFDSCTFTISVTSTSARINIGELQASHNVKIATKNCSFVFANASQRIALYSPWEDYNSTFAGTGTVPTTLFEGGSGAYRLIGSNLAAITGTLFSAVTSKKSEATLCQCKLGAAVSVLAAGGAPYDWDIYIADSASGDTHYEFAHYNSLGNTTISTAVYMSGTDGASYNAADAKHSWKVTGVNGTYELPYVSPWISKYNEGTSAITPRLEVMRDNNSTAYKDDQVWAEFMVKVTTGFTAATFNDSDKCAVLTHNAGTAANQASSALGAGDWIGETGTPWFGKLEPSATITPAEIGHIRARVCVAGTNTVYVNPKILGT